MPSSVAHHRIRRPRAPRGWLLLVALLGFTALTACKAAPAPPVAATQTAGTSLWLSPSEIASLPTAGPAWTNVVAVANSDWGTASLSDNNATHDTSTLAGAIVGARTGDDAMIAKTRAAIMSVTKVTTYARVLELSRNVPSYVIAADIVGLRPTDDAAFKTFLAGLRTKPLAGHSGGTDLYSTALRSPNNWGAMARAAMTAIDLYIGDRDQLDTVADTYRAWLGEAVPNTLRFSATNWHATDAKAGINRRGATKFGRNIDGVLPEDQRRTGEATSGPAEKGSYPWEALQGAVVTGVLLDRAGIVDINAGDHALERAFTWLYTTDANPAAADDRWQPWLLNRVAGTTFATGTASSAGKNMAWTQLTHGS